MVLIFKSFIDNLTKLNILTGERQRGESWALENVLNPTPGSQDQAVYSQSFQISNMIIVVITQNTYIQSFQISNIIIVVITQNTYIPSFFFLLVLK